MNEHKHTIGFIGGGNMASSLVGGLLKSGHPASHIAVVDIDFRAERRRRRSVERGGP